MLQKVGENILYLFYLVAIFMCFFSVIGGDPLKRAFFLIGSCLRGVIFFSVFVSSWLCYFLVLLFLRGIFFIIVYLARLCSLRVVELISSFWVLVLRVYLRAGTYIIVGRFDYGIVKYFLGGFFIYFFWVFLMLFYLFFVISYYFSSFRGALRNF